MPRRGFPEWQRWRDLMLAWDGNKRQSGCVVTGMPFRRYRHSGNQQLRRFSSRIWKLPRRRLRLTNTLGGTIIFTSAIGRCCVRCRATNGLTPADGKETSFPGIPSSARHPTMPAGTIALARRAATPVWRTDALCRRRINRLDK